MSGMSCSNSGKADASNIGRKDMDTCVHFCSKCYSTEANAALAFDANQFDDDTVDQEPEPIPSFHEANGIKLAGKRKTPCDREGEEEPDFKRQELVDNQKRRHRAGRKPSTVEPASKRKAQNRASQRAFRERKEKQLKDLEAKVSELIEIQEADAKHKSLLQAGIKSLQKRLAECSRKPTAELFPRCVTELVNHDLQYGGTTESKGGHSDIPDSSFPEHSDAIQIEPAMKPCYHIADETKDEPLLAQKYCRLPGTSQTHIYNSAFSQLNNRRSVQSPASLERGSKLPRTIASQTCIWKDTSSESSELSKIHPHIAHDASDDFFSLNTFGNAHEERSSLFASERSASQTGSSNDVWSCDNVREPNSISKDGECSHVGSIGATGGNFFSQSRSKPEHDLIADMPPQDLNEQTMRVWQPGVDVNLANWLTQSSNSSSSSGNSLAIDRASCGTSYFDRADGSAFGTYRDNQPDLSRVRADSSSDVYDEMLKTPLFPYSSPSTIFGILQPGCECADVKHSADVAATNIVRPSKNLLAEVQMVRDEGGDDELTSHSRVVGRSQKLNGKLIDCYQIWNQLRTNVDFQEGKFDLDALCAELQAKAPCTETGELVDQQKVEATFKDLRRRKVTEVNVLGPRLLFEQASWDSAIERLIPSGQL